MYFVLYDRFLKSIGETYVLESWSRTQRATDFDDLKIVGAEVPYSANPFFVVANDKQGRQMFSGLASTPAIDDKTKKTTILLKDYLTLFNSEILVDWVSFTGSTVGSLINFIFSTFKAQVSVGFENIICDTSNIEDLSIDKSLYLSSEKENLTAYSLILDAVNYYDLYIESKLDIAKKTLTFYFKKALAQTAEVKLSDFGIDVVEKSFGDFNRATVYSSSYVKTQEWALTEDNEVVKLPTDKNLIYPAKNKNFIAGNSLNDAVYDAVMGLAQNRYQENIDLNVKLYKSTIDLTNIDFSYQIKVFTNDGKYRNLPVGEIETDSKGKHIVRLGHRIQELTQEL